MKIIFLVGLPGSGKSYLGNQLKGVFIDDIQFLSSLPKNIDILIISDVYFCKKEVREKAVFELNSIYNSPEIEFIFFENDPVKCLNNVKYRNDGRKVEGFIRLLTKEYDIPNGVITKPIWQKE